jgi:ABC-type nitrate/sulfonate/bicarbonate transport system substrate-binding protein
MPSLQAALSRRSFVAGLSIGAVSLLTGCGTAGRQPSATPVQKRELKIAFVNNAGVNAPVWLADITGAFTQRGLTVKSQLIAGDVAAKALIAREIDLLFQAAAPIITADLNGGADLAIIASGFNHSQHALLTLPDIHTPAEFKGKVLGSDRAGSTNDYQNRVLLKLMGLQPSDVTLRVLGGGDTFLPALISGQIQAGALAPPQVYQAEAAGFHILQDSYSQPYQGGGWVTSRARFAELAPALPPFLAAFRQGMITFRQQPQLAKDVLRQYTKTTDADLLDKTYDFFINKSPFQEDLQPTLEGIQGMLDYLADTLPAARTAMPDQFVDLRFLT